MAVTAPDARTITNMANYSGATAIVVNTPYTAARGLMVSCTAAGAVVVTMLAGGNLTFTPAVGTFFYPLETTNVVSSGGTCTFAAMS